MARRKTREATAYHEAGHAVARYFLGLKFKEASIIPDSSEGTLGHVLFGRHPKWFDPESDISPRVRLRAEEDIVSTFAGAAAEERYRGHHPRWGV